METLPEHALWEILSRFEKTADRNSVSLACKRLHKVDNEQRQLLRIGCGLHPANEALNSLCHRFPNLIKVEITYSGWMSKLGKQLDDSGLLVLSRSCPYLRELSLSYCTFITDMGLRQLASCTNLSSLKLKFTPRITGCGILSIVAGCKNITVLHLVRCLNISGFEWLECLGRHETIVELMIKNCRGIGEGDLVSLRQSWQKLKRFQFEVDSSYRYAKVYDRLGAGNWQKQLFPCDNMAELWLANCIISPGKGLACVLPKCKNLEKVHLDMCLGVRDSDIMGLAQNSTQLRSIFLCLPSDFLNNPHSRLTDESLEALALNCPLLESIRISFLDGEFPSMSSFSQEGILNLIKSCPVRELSLDRVYSFNDLGMEALCTARWMQSLELERCQEISDDGLMLVARFPRLRVLRLCKCLGVSDDGLRPLVGSSKLDVLAVEDCPMISEKGANGIARSVSYKQDLSWMY